VITADHQLRAVLDHYPAACQPLAGKVEPLGGAGGFSGAQFWRFASASGLLLLRRWPPEHPTVERLQFIQAVLWHVHQEGFRRAPLPLETRRHAGFVQHAGHLWEITPWMAGKADYHRRPTPERLCRAMTTLAEFHCAAASFPLPGPTPAPAPGLRQRWDELKRLQQGGLDRLRLSVDRSLWPELADRAVLLLELFSRAAPRVSSTLSRVLDQPVPLTPCIRDIWHDHVLFEADAVTALIDFGAMRPENVAADVSRLLGSLVGDDESGWAAGLNAYQHVRSLSRQERQLVTAFDQSSVLLSSLNWLQWVFLEGRQFENPQTILARVDANLARLNFLATQ
jgi:Ser/Thr protein kinase RdoA (MazF antagonist)